MSKFKFEFVISYYISQYIKYKLRMGKTWTPKWLESEKKEEEESVFKNRKRKSVKIFQMEVTRMRKDMLL